MSSILVVLVLCLCVCLSLSAVRAATLKSFQNTYTTARCTYHPIENAECVNVVPSDLYVAVGVPVYLVLCEEGNPVGLTYQGGNGTSIQNLGMGPVPDGTVMDFTLTRLSTNETRTSHVTSSCVTDPVAYKYSWSPPTSGSFGAEFFTCCILKWTPPDGYQNNIYLQLSTGVEHAKLSTVDPSPSGAGTGSGTGGTGSSPPSSPSGSGTGTDSSGSGTGSSPPANGTSPSSPTGGATPTGTGATPIPTSPSATSSGSNSSSSTGSGPTPTSPSGPNHAAANAPHSVALSATLLVLLAAFFHIDITQ